VGSELDVTFGGADSNLYNRAWSGGAWQVLHQLAPSVANTIPPRTVAAAGGSVDLIAVWSRSGDNVLEYATRANHQWGSAGMLFDTLTYSPNAVSTAMLANGQTWLVYQGGDGKPYVCKYSGHDWSGYAPLIVSNNPQLASPPQVAPGICGDDAEISYVLLDGSVHVARVRGDAFIDEMVGPAGTATYAAIATVP
jgi:hypothetical protein